MHWEEAWLTQAATQEGLLARFHARELGGTAKQWWRAMRNGRWDALSPRVLRVHGASESEGQRVLAAVLDASPGAILHGSSALAWFGLRGFNLRAIHIARPHKMSSTPPNLAVAHELRELKPHHVLVVRGVPTESPVRAIWSEAAHYASPRSAEVGVQKVGRLLDQAHKKGLVTWAALHEMVNDIRRRGRSGSVIMRTLADARPPGSSPTESRNEQRFEEIVADACMPALKRQIVVGGHEPIGRVDFVDLGLPLVVEINSLTFHTAPSDREADRIRYRRLNDAGFSVAVVWETDLWSNPGDAVRTVVRARAAARAGNRTVHHSPSCPWP